MKKKVGTMCGCICGGIISESQLKKRCEKKGGMHGIMMCLVMKDKDYAFYEKLIKENKPEQADKFSEKVARSLI